MPIQILEDRVFCLHTNNMSYVLRIDEGNLVCCHWGARIERGEDFLLAGGPGEWYNNPDPMREECSAFGNMHFKETSLKVRYEDGTRDFRCVIESWHCEGEELSIRLKDSGYPLFVTLHYRVHPDEDILEKWRTAQWQGDGCAVLERFHSAEYSLPGRGYQSMNYRGHWGTEFRAFSEPVDSGKKVYESLHSLPGHGCSPFFVVHKNACEEQGEVWFGALGYSGNFKVVVEAAPKNYLSILAGMADTDFEVRLAKGESFDAPPVYAGYSGAGFEKMSHILSHFAHCRLMPAYWRQRPLPVLYNSWYATTFDVRCDEQIALAERAAKLGVELFVVDDGWFKGRNNDKAGLGDWTPDPVKFPNGLEPLITRVKELGMTFGLWIEPEMVNPDSDLFRAHPEWILHYQNREALTWRNQYMLDMGNPDVLGYLCTVFDTLLTEHDISYIKWDMNRFAAEVGGIALPPGRYKEMWHRNTGGFYKFIAFLRQRHPAVEFEACASGGGRVDYGALQWFDEYWPTDNTDPLDRLEMQYNYSYVYPVKYMRAWLTDDFGMDHRRVPLRFAMHVSMCGALGIGVDLNRKTDAEIEAIRPYVEVYKEVRECVQFGDVYRLKKTSRDHLHAVEYVKGDEAVLFAFLEHERYGAGVHRILLRGLEADALYAYETEIDGIVKQVVKSGAYLMSVGITLRLQGDYASEMIRFCKAAH